MKNKYITIYFNNGLNRQFKVKEDKCESFSKWLSSETKNNYTFDYISDDEPAKCIIIKQSISFIEIM